MALIKRNTAYSLNDIVNTKYGTKLKCTTAGTTSTDPLILDGTYPITDGTVVWEVYEEGITYSTEEKRIGTWIDGKPLYQKTYTCDKEIPYGTWYNTDIAMPANIGVIVTSVVRDMDYAMNFISISQNFETGKFSAFNIRNATMLIKNFTITYTKTTD